MATTVIIPARNEEATIGAIVSTFNRHPETMGHVYVGIDADTKDGTSIQVWNNGGCGIQTDRRGKGQVVRATLNFPIKVTPRIILCDADYTGLTVDHVNQILGRSRGMVIGVPDWPEIEVPPRVINAWPQIAGFRCLPWSVITDIEEPHGYLLETQINIECIRRRLPIHHSMMAGLKAPFQWPLAIQRQAEMERDREWGLSHGVL